MWQFSLCNIQFPCQRLTNSAPVIRFSQFSNFPSRIFDSCVKGYGVIYQLAARYPYYTINHLCPRRNNFEHVINLDFLRVSSNIDFLHLPPFPETFPKSMIININTDHSTGSGIY